MNTTANLDDLADGERCTLRVGEYHAGERCEVSVHRRQNLYDIDDNGRAVELAGRPTGWLDCARALAAAEGMNVNRSGTVFVQGREGRDNGRLAERIGELSRTIYAELLSLDD